MGLDTYDVLWRGLLLRCPAAGPMLARQWVTHSFREIVEKRRWSWLVKNGQFLLNDVYKTGTVTVTHNNLTVTGAGTAFTAAMVGRQFRIPSTTPIYTVIAVDVALQTLTLDAVWGGATTSGTSYQIYNAYVTAPSDFHSFVTIWDPRFNWQLWTQVAQEELNAWDSQRAQSGTTWVIAQLRYDTTVTPPLPMYEIWPHQTAQYVYPFLYESRPPDLEDSGAALPRYIPGNVVLEGALAKAARWPGASTDSSNPYFNLNLALMHDKAYTAQVAELERQDDEVYEADLRIQSYVGLPFAPLPLGDAAWLQKHAL